MPLDSIAKCDWNPTLSKPAMGSILVDKTQKQAMTEWHADFSANKTSVIKPPV